MNTAIKDTLFKLGSGLNNFLYRRSGGRIGGSIGKAKILLLTTTGRKSGQPRTVPLLYIPDDGDRLLLVASFGGDPRHPAWFKNLTANPLVTVEIGRERKTMRATVADADEKQRLWPKAVTAYKGYDRYQRHTERDIPVVILTPV